MEVCVFLRDYNQLICPAWTSKVQTGLVSIDLMMVHPLRGKVVLLQNLMISVFWYNLRLSSNGTDVNLQRETRDEITHINDYLDHKHFFKLNLVQLATFARSCDSPAH